MTWRPISAGKTYEDDGELLVYYSRASGSTHLISRVAAYILDLLEECPRSTEEVVAAVAEAGGMDVEEARESVERLIGELQRFELVEATE